MSLTIYFIIILITLCYAWVRRRYSFWRNRGYLQAAASFPFGSFKGFFTKVTWHEALDVCYKEFKGKAPAIGVYTFLSPTILVIDPELIKNVLIHEFPTFQSRFKKEDLSNFTVLTLDGQEWKDRRAILAPMFTLRRTKMMFETIDTIGDKFVTILDSHLDESGVQDMRNWAQRFTADNIGNVAFGLECSCLEDKDSEFIKHSRRLLDMTIYDYISLFFTECLFNLAGKLGIKLSIFKTRNFFLETFQQTLEYRLTNVVERDDFMSMILEHADHLTAAEVFGESVIIFIAGYETSSTLIAFTLYALALNPDIQQRLREEITEGLEENEGNLTYELLMGFKYLDMVTQETLRMFPPVPNNMRICNADYKIPGTELVIPKDTTVEFNMYSLQHDPEYFPDPEKFDPERFSDENVRNIKPFTYLPFGKGARACPGMRLGLMQSKVGIAKLIANFAFSPCEKTPIPMKFVPSSVFLAPRGGMWLNVERI